MRHPFLKLSALHLGLILSPFMLSSCDAIGTWADNNLPVIGPRCEHWQCFTKSGQEASDEEKTKLQNQSTAGAPTPVPSSATPTPAPQAPTPFDQHVPDDAATTL